jgi:hypothetical protein
VIAPTSVSRKYETTYSRGAEVVARRGDREETLA